MTHPDSNIPPFDFDTHEFSEDLWKSYVADNYKTASGNLDTVLTLPMGRAMLNSLLHFDSYTENQVRNINAAYIKSILQHAIFNDALNAGTSLRIFYERMDKTPQNLKELDKLFSLLVYTGQVQFLDYPYINKNYGLNIPENGPDILRIVVDTNDTMSSNIPHILMAAPPKDFNDALSDSAHYLSVVVRKMFSPELAARTIDLRIIDTDYYALAYKCLPNLTTIEETYIQPEQKLSFYLSQLELSRQAQSEDDNQTYAHLKRYRDTDAYLIQQLTTQYPNQFKEFQTLKSLGFKIDYKTLQAQVLTSVAETPLDGMQF